MAQIISISEAKQKLLELSRRNVELGESFVVVKDSVPVSALIPFEEYESILETLDILETEPDILKKLKIAEKEVAAGHFVRWTPPKTKSKVKKK